MFGWNERLSVGYDGKNYRIQFRQHPNIISKWFGATPTEITYVSADKVFWYIEPDLNKASVFTDNWLYDVYRNHENRKRIRR